MDIKWLHSPMVKIADAMENKTTVYKVPVPFLYGNLLLYGNLGLWDVVSPFHLASMKSAYNGGEMQVIHLFRWAPWALGEIHPLPRNGKSEEKACSLKQLSKPSSSPENRYARLTTWLFKLQIWVFLILPSFHLVSGIPYTVGHQVS